MKNLKMLFVAVAVIFSSTLSAGSEKFTDPDSVSLEVERMLEETKYEREKEFTITLFFSISEDNRIQSLSVASPNEELNQYLLKKLDNQELLGSYWRSGKIYEVDIVSR